MHYLWNVDALYQPCIYSCCLSVRSLLSVAIIRLSTEPLRHARRQKSMLLPFLAYPQMAKQGSLSPELVQCALTVLHYSCAAVHVKLML